MRTARLRRLLVVTGLFVTAAVGVSGCGDKYGDSGSRHDPARTAERARQVSDAWEGSAAARAWRAGYFPLGDPVRLPEGAFHSDADKQAYQRQNFELRGSLPGAPPKKGEVRWPSGGSLAVPVVPARAAYEKVGTGSGPGTGPRLTVTGARLGEMTIRTSRGPATVPAWHFTIKGYDTPLKRVAVVASKLPKPPVKPVPDLTADLWELAGLDTVSRDGRTVVLRAHHGACDDGPGVDVLESGDNVVFSTWIRNPSDGLCTKELRARKVTVKLDRPVGDRMLLDAFTGRPVPYEGSPGSRSSSWS